MAINRGNTQMDVRVGNEKTKKTNIVAINRGNTQMDVRVGNEKQKRQT